MKRLLLILLSCQAAFAALTSPITLGQVASGTYTSGGTITGTVGQTCTVTMTAPTGGVNAVATVALTGTNVIAGGTALTITTPGQGFTAAPTTGTLSNGTATCSTTATISTALGTLATLTWYTYTTGSDSNGGCFDPALGGTNFANAAAATVVFSAGNSNQLSAAQNSTTVTSAGTPFLNAHIGNCIQIASGTNFVVGVYKITAVGSSSSITVDRAPATAGAGSVGNGNLAGALATLGASTGLLLYQEGSTTAYIKATASYTPSGNLLLPQGVPGTPTIWRGFTSTITDGGSATIAPSSGEIVTVEGYSNLENLIWDGGGSNFFITDINLAQSHAIVRNVVINHFTTEGLIATGGNNVILNSLAENGKAACVAGFTTSGVGSIFMGDVSTANPCDGFKDTNASPSSTWNRCLSYANTGGSSHGFELSGSSSGNPKFVSVVAYNNGGAGISCTNAGACDTLTVIDSAFVDNATYGISSAVTVYNNTSGMDFNAFFGNTTNDLQNFVHGPNDFCASGCATLLSGVPFASAGTGNFGLNATANQGAALKGTGWPGVFPLGLSTGHLDVGAVQTTPGTGASQSAYAF